MPGRLFPKPLEGQAPIEFGRGAHIVKTRTFDLSVARNLEQIEIGGSCLWAFAATSLTAVIDFRINDQLRDPLSFRQGMFVGGVPFSRVYASHAAQPGETISIFFVVEEDVAQIRIVNPSLGFTYVNIGNITQDDSWLYHTMRERAFIGSGTADTDMNGFAAVQLWNPAASGRNLLCHDIVFMSTVTVMTVPLHIAHHNAALANDGVDGNKWLTTAIGVGDVMQAGNLIALLGTDISLLPVQPNIYIRLPLPKPILIPPGIGLTLQIEEMAKWLTATFQWVEIDA